jgi:hypothetical protein
MENAGWYFDRQFGSDVALCKSPKDNTLSGTSESDIVGA